MMSAQTKLSVDTAKEVQADATLKTKVQGDPTSSSQNCNEPEVNRK